MTGRCARRRGSGGMNVAVRIGRTGPLGGGATRGGGSRNFIPGRSILTHPDPQALPDAWAGTGHPVNAVPIGQPGSKERVDFGEGIGEYGNPGTGLWMRETKGIS